MAFLNTFIFNIILLWSLLLLKTNINLARESAQKKSELLLNYSKVFAELRYDSPGFREIRDLRIV